MIAGYLIISNGSAKPVVIEQVKREPRTWIDELERWLGIVSSIFGITIILTGTHIFDSFRNELSKNLWFINHRISELPRNMS